MTFFSSSYVSQFLKRESSSHFRCKLRFLADTDCVSPLVDADADSFWVAGVSSYGFSAGLGVFGALVPPKYSEIRFILLSTQQTEAEKIPYHYSN